jgi:MFS family permease
MLDTQVHNVDTERSNFNHLVIDIAWFGLAFAATNRFLPVFAIRLGASPFELGLISSVPAFLLLLTSTLGAWWRNRYQTTLRALIPVSLIVRLPFLLPVFAPLFPTAFQPWWLVLSVSLPALAQGMASVTFVVFMRETVSNSRMTELLSFRQLSLNVTLGIAALLYGMWLEHAPFPLNYQSMYLLSFVFALMSVYHVSRCKPILPEAALTHVKVSLKESLLAPLTAWRSRTFQPVILFAWLTHFTFMVAAPYVTLFLVRHHNAAEGFVALFGLVELASAAAAGLIAPRVVRKIGNRPLMALGMLGTGLGIVIITLAPNVNLTLIGALFTGASWAATAGIGLFGFYMETAPTENGAPYSIAYHQALGLGMALGSTLGGALAGGGAVLIPVLLIGATLRITSAIIIEATMARQHSNRLAMRVAHLPSPGGD